MSTDKSHLTWVYSRMAGVHQENENVDYMQRFKKIIDSMPDETSTVITIPRKEYELLLDQSTLLNHLSGLTAGENNENNNRTSKA